MILITIKTEQGLGKYVFNTCLLSLNVNSTWARTVPFLFPQISSISRGEPGALRVNDKALDSREGKGLALGNSNWLTLNARSFDFALAPPFPTGLTCLVGEPLVALLVLPGSWDEAAIKNSLLLPQCPPFGSLYKLHSSRVSYKAVKLLLHIHKEETSDTSELCPGHTSVGA